MVFSIAHGNEVHLVACIGVGDDDNHHAQQSCGVGALLDVGWVYQLKPPF